MAKIISKGQNKKTKDSEDKRIGQNPISMISDRATKRVIAPFVRIVRKDVKPVEAEEAKQFSFYLQKKPSVLIRDLSSFLSDSVDLPSLLHETAEVLKNVTKAAGVTLYMMDPANNDIYISKKIPVVERHKIRWKIQGGTTVAAFVANKKEYVLVDDILDDERFPEGIGYEGETIKSVLCVPVVTPDGECFAVIELYRQLFDGSFDTDDLRITIIVTGWMGAAIHQNSQRLALKRQHELNDYLLDLTKCYFGEKVVMEKMVSEVVNFAKVTLGAERGTFFVIDRESDELIADMFDDTDDDTKPSKPTKVRFGKERGIAALVARTGITVNVKDAYTDARFNKEIDQKTGFITRSILCMPITGTSGVLGVVQVVNKKTGGCFTHTDELLFRTFCTYSALALSFTKAFKQMCCSKNLHNIFLNLIQLQMKPCSHDLEHMMLNPEVPIPSNFHEFSWYISTNDQPKIPQFCLYMILQLIDKSDVDLQQMIEFILTVRKLYRKVPYHNFEHAFHTLHTMFLILRRNPVKFSPLEMKAMIIGAFCHDVDHPGFSNNYLLLVGDDITAEDESTLPNYHHHVTMQIMKNIKMFPKLTESEIAILHEEIKEIILGIDMFRFFQRWTLLNDIVKTKSFDWKNPLHRSYLKTIIIVTCNLSGQCKPFLVAKRVTDHLHVEYYRQGDLIKEMGLCPLAIMDREKTYTFPEEQVRFLRVVVLPCVDLLKRVLPNTSNLYFDCNMLMETWQDIIEVRGKKCWRQDDSIVEKTVT